jgi:GAF domain-containing protein
MSPNSQVLTEIATHAQALVQAETAVVALAEDGGETVYYAAAVGKHADAILDRRGDAAKSGLCGVAFQGQQPVLVCQTKGDRRVRQDMAETLGIETALAVPILHEDQLQGALMVLNRIDGANYDKAAEQLLADYAEKIAAKLL